MKLCSFNDPCGETAVAAASSNKKEQQRRALDMKRENGCYEHSTFDIFNTHAHKVEDM